METRHCPACEEDRPLDVFGSRASGGPRSWCRTCESEKAAERRGSTPRARDPEGHKTCLECDQVLPHDAFRFVRNAPRARCRACEKTLRARGKPAPAIEGTKVCPQCDQVLPVADFGMRTESRVRSWCKSCEQSRRRKVRERRRKSTLPLGFKRCCGCLQVLSLEDFSMVNGKPRSRCKACTTDQRKLEYWGRRGKRERKLAATLEERTLAAEQVLAEGMKTCRACERKLPLSLFFHNKVSLDGHEGVCRYCRGGNEPLSTEDLERVLRWAARREAFGDEGDLRAAVSW